MTDVINALAKSFYTTLTGGTALTALLSTTTAVYHQAAPEDADLPFVLYSFQGGGDENKSPNRTLNLVMFARAYSSVSAAQAGSIDAQIDALLHMGTLTVTGSTNIWTARESVLSLVEPTPTGELIGLTAIGRATLAALRMNSESQRAARRVWPRLGLFP